MLPKMLTVCLYGFLMLGLSCNHATGQEIEYAREVIKKLCSNALKGRGYVDGGDKKAANFLVEEFEKAGLKKYSKTYFQNFTTPVNSFPGKMSLSVNGQTLKPGEDFLIDPDSPGITGKFSVVMLTAEDLLDDGVWMQKIKSNPSAFVAIAAYNKANYKPDQLTHLNEVISFLKYHKDNPAKGVLMVTNEKLTWSASTELNTKPSFTIKENVVQEPITSIEVSAENKFLKNHATQNVIGYIPGTHLDSLLVFTAHYDHLGMMGQKTIFPGANDNASGVSILLNLIKHFAGTKPKYTLVFIAFAGEEIGLVGSRYFTTHPVFPLKQIKFLINFDLAGTGDDGIQVVNGKIYQQQFDTLSALNDRDKLLKQIKIRGEACNSDHCMFYSKGVPCFFIYTLGGIQAYHDIHDRADTLPLTEYKDYFTLILKFITRL